MLELRNPVPASVRDTGKVEKFFREFGSTIGEEKRWIIPYYGDSEGTSHTFLQLIKHLTSKSPSYKSAESGIVKYAFGGFEDNTFFETLAQYGIGKAQLLRVCKAAFRHYMQSGNAWIRVVISVVDGQISVRLKNEHYFYVAYLNTKPGEDREALVVVDWDYERWETDLAKPELIKVSTLEEPWNWSQAGPDTIQTIIHIREWGNDESDWYGRPDILAVLEWMFSETVQGDHVCKVNATDLVAKLLLFFEAEEPVITRDDEDEEEDSFTQTVRALKAIMTNDPTDLTRKASGMAAIEYGNGTKPPTPVKLDINRDTNWFESSLDQGKSMIYSVVGWYRELTGMAQSKTGIGSDILVNLFLVANAGTIEPIQSDWEGYISTMIEQIGEAIGQNWAGQEFELTNKIDRLVQALVANRSSNKQTANDDATEE